MSANSEIFPTNPLSEFTNFQFLNPMKVESESKKILPKKSQKIVWI